MKPCPCGDVPTTSSDITYSVVWCPSCHKTLTKQYLTPESAILAWQHGEEALPPNCPFCYWAPLVLGPHTPTPQVVCEMPCPLRGRIFTLEEWNRCRPEPRRLNELVKRWEKEKKPFMKGPIRALKRAIQAHVRNRYRGD